MRRYASPSLIPLHPAPESPGFPRHHDPGGEGRDGAAYGLYQTAFDQGKIILGGAVTDGAIGIIVWRVDSAEEMQRIYENDPAVKAGIGYPELHPFRIGMVAGE